MTTTAEDNSPGVKVWAAPGLREHAKPLAAACAQFAKEPTLADLYKFINGPQAGIIKRFPRVKKAGLNAALEIFSSWSPDEKASAAPEKVPLNEHKKPAPAGTKVKRASRLEQSGATVQEIKEAGTRDPSEDPGTGERREMTQNYTIADDGEELDLSGVDDLDDFELEEEEDDEEQPGQYEEDDLDALMAEDCDRPEPVEVLDRPERPSERERPKRGRDAGVVSEMPGPAPKTKGNRRKRISDEECERLGRLMGQYASAGWVLKAAVGEVGINYRKHGNLLNQRPAYHDAYFEAKRKPAPPEIPPPPPSATAANKRRPVKHDAAALNKIKEAILEHLAAGDSVKAAMEKVKEPRTNFYLWASEDVEWGADCEAHLEKRRVEAATAAEHKADKDRAIRRLQKQLEGKQAREEELQRQHKLELEEMASARDRAVAARDKEIHDLQARLAGIGDRAAGILTTPAANREELLGEPPDIWPEAELVEVYLHPVTMGQLQALAETGLYGTGTISEVVQWLTAHRAAEISQASQTTNNGESGSSS